MRSIHKLCIVIFLAALTLSSCKKSFLDINQDPNRATDDNITPELIFVSAAEATGAATVGVRATSAGARSSMQFAYNWIGYMASNGDFARDNTETSYNIDFTFSNGQFQFRYGVLADLHQVEKKALARGNKTLAGAAMILSAKMYQDLVDLFGDVPYSQAFDIANYPQPVYDKAQDIYKDLQLKLDTAIQYMNLVAPKSFESIDIVNHGKLLQWIKLANTLKLRLLIRQSEINGFNPSTEISKIYGGNSPGTLGKGESVTENPGYLNDLNKQSPFYANYGYTTNGIKATTSTNANQYIIDALVAAGDPRLSRFFNVVNNIPNAYVGNQYGDDPGNLNSGGASSYFGEGVLKGPGQDQLIMSSFESLFLQSEAIARGWIAGDVKSVFDTAIKESFKWLGADTSADFIAYLKNSDAANWDNAGTSVASQVRFIAYQKYLSNTLLDPLESYADQRRLNFLPAGYISANPSRISNTIPLRLPYPQSEFTTNAANVQKVGTIDVFRTKLFWEP